jgi:hypothetical protein
VAYSYDGFPVATAEEFLEILRALAAGDPDAPKPAPMETFLASHPRAKQFADAPKPAPASSASESFFASPTTVKPADMAIIRSIHSLLKNTRPPKMR